LKPHPPPLSETERGAPAERVAPQSGEPPKERGARDAEGRFFDSSFQQFIGIV